MMLYELLSDAQVERCRGCSPADEDLGNPAEVVSAMPREMIERALMFYCSNPDGQYDLTVVVPVLAAELARRESGRAGSDALISAGYWAG